MKARELAEKISMNNLPLRNKILLSFAISSVLPMLVMVYIIFLFKTFSPESVMKGHLLLNVNLLVPLMALLSVLGFTINLDLFKGIKELLRKTREIFPDQGVEKDGKCDEMSLLYHQISSIVGKMNDQFEQLSKLEENLENAKEHLRATDLEFEKLAVKDDLTGVFNRSFFDTRLSQEVDRANRYHNSVSMMFVDIDNFKSVNEKFGHLVGDMVLKAFAGVLKNSLRDIDVVARYNGQKFAIILPEAKARDAVVVAERLRREIEEHIFLEEAEGMNFQLTVSIGISSIGEGNESSEEMVKKAEKAVHKVKEEGKNRVGEYSEDVRHLSFSNSPADLTRRRGVQFRHA